MSLSRQNADGETQIRTGDTTIFSRVLYQLSYLAADRPSIGDPMLLLLEFLDQRLVGQPQALVDRHLGAPTQLAFGAADVQATVR